MDEDLKEQQKKDYQRTWRENNQDIVMGHRVRIRYGITLDEYYKAMKSSHCCEICGLEENLCYDHDHITGDFRGILCITCNTALGKLGDTLEGVNRAYMYLKNYKNKGGK